MGPGIASHRGRWREHGPLLSQKWSHLSFGSRAQPSFIWSPHTVWTPHTHTCHLLNHLVLKMSQKYSCDVSQPFILPGRTIFQCWATTLCKSFCPLMITQGTKSPLACNQQFLPHAHVVSCYLFVRPSCCSVRLCWTNIMLSSRDTRAGSFLVESV